MPTDIWTALYPQLAIFPLHVINADRTCGCGYAACANVGKHPDGAWGDLEPGEKRRSKDHPRAGYGIATGIRSGIIVLDVDDFDSFNELIQCVGPMPDTLEVRTGRGVQFYFKAPGFPVRNSAGDLAPGVDIRGDGGYVVAPGSPHKSGKTYEIICDAPPADAPRWLIDWLRSRPAPAEAHQYDGDVTEPDELEYRRGLYTKYLETAPVCTEGQAGDAQLFRIVQRGAYDLCLPTADVLELIRKNYDHRCRPPWGGELDDRVRHKSTYSKLSSTRARMEPLPRELFADFPKTVDEISPVSKPEVAGIVWGGWDVTPAPPNYLVEGLIPVETVGMFVAMGSSLKTWTALDLARAVANGAPWLGRYPTKVGKALVVDFESGMTELQRRVHLLEKGDLSNLGAWSYPSARIDDDAFWKVLAEFEGLRLVIVDSLAEGAPGIDENDRAAARPLSLAARFTEATKASVLFIHHSTKGDSGDDRKNVRGSSALYAACDWAYKFESIEETKSYRRMHMCCIKPCMGPKPPPVHLELTDSGLTWFEEGNQVKLTNKEATPEAIQGAICLALAAAGSEGIATKAKLASAVGLRADRVNPEIDVLKVRKEIAIIPGRGYVLDSPAARARRILDAVNDGNPYRTEAQIGKAAGVSTGDVGRLVASGGIVRSAEGRYLACIEND